MSHDKVATRRRSESNEGTEQVGAMRNLWTSHGHVVRMSGASGCRQGKGQRAHDTMCACHAGGQTWLQAQEFNQ